MSAAHSQHRSGSGHPGSTDETSSHTPSTSSLSQQSASKEWPSASAWRDINARSVPFATVLPSARGEISPTNTFMTASQQAASSPPTTLSSDTLASSSRGDSASFHQRFASPASAGMDGRSPSPTRRGPFSFGNEARDRWSSIGQAQQSQPQQAPSQTSHDSQKRAAGKPAFSNDPLFVYGDIWGSGGGGGSSSSGTSAQQRGPIDADSGRHRAMGSISVDTMRNRFDTMDLHNRQPDGFSDGRTNINGGHASRPSMQDQALAANFPPLGPAAGGAGSLSPRSMMLFHRQQQMHAVQQMASHPGMPSAQLSTTGALDAPRNGEEITTVFIVGFPDDMSEREFANMFLFAKGFEASTLKIPAGIGAPSVPGRSIENGGSGPGGPYNAVNMGGYDSLQSGNGTSSAGTGSWDEPSTQYGAMGANGPLSAGSVGGPPGKIKQIIGFAKFRTRAEALEARDALNGRKIDVERGCVLKTEMAKKNLHTKQRPVLSSNAALDGQAASQAQTQQQFAPAHVSQQQASLHPQQQPQPQQQQFQQQPPPNHAQQGFGGAGQTGESVSQQAYTSQAQQAIMTQGPPPGMIQSSLQDAQRSNEHAPSSNYASYQSHSSGLQQGPQHFDPFYGHVAAGGSLNSSEVVSPSGEASQYGRAASRSFSNVTAQDSNVGDKWVGRGPLDYFDNNGNSARQSVQAPSAVHPPPAQSSQQQQQHTQHQQAPVSFAAVPPHLPSGGVRGAGWNTTSSPPPGLSANPSVNRPIAFGEIHSQQVNAAGSQPSLHFAQAASRAAAAAAATGAAQTPSNREDFRRGESDLAKQSPSPSRATTASLTNGNATVSKPAPQIIAPIAVQGGAESQRDMALITSPPPPPPPPSSQTAATTQRPQSRISNRATSPPIHGGGVARFGSMRIDSPMQNQRPFSPHAYMRSPPPGDALHRATSPGSPPISSPTSRSFSIDANPPGNTLFVGNLPASITGPPASTQLEDLLYKAFSAKTGFRQMSFRVKQSGPMSFIEFDDVGCAGRALGELNGDTLDGLVKGGLRLSFSKHPLFKGTTSAASSQHGGAQTPPVTGVGMNGSGGLQTHEQKATTNKSTTVSFDLDAISTLEERSYKRGYHEGNEHGKLHGLFEGRQLGTEKGFELWLELGTMEGTAETWLKALSTNKSRKAQKQCQQLQGLLAAISELPMSNDETVDIGAEMDRVRARYKSIRFSLGIKENVSNTEDALPQEAIIKGRKVNTSKLTF